MRWWIPLLAVVGLAAQEPAPVGIIRGEFLGWKGTATAGQLSILTYDRHFYQFSFDRMTYFEKEARPIPISDALSGDRVEIVCDRGTSAILGYARSVEFLNPPRRAPRGQIDWPKGDPTESIVPRGNVTLAGLIVRISPGQLVLRVRTGEERSVLLRGDTVYLDHGSRVNATSLKVNTHVFVRGGNNIDEELEAYSVIWGKILMPARP
jgi:hypothetical protein